MVIVHIQCKKQQCGVGPTVGGDTNDSTMDTVPPAAHSAPPVPSHQVHPPEGGHWRQARQSLQQQQQGIWTTQRRLS